jgi:MFS family permease
MVIGLLLAALTLPVLALPGSILLEGGGLLLLGIALGLLMTPTLPALSDAVDRSGASGYGIAYAIYNTAYSLGMMGGPMLGGLLVGSFGLLIALTLVGLLTLLAVPALVVALARL